MTTPKLPPPPRIAQNRSGFSSALGADPLAARQHDLRLEQVVDRQAALAGQVAHAAAEREAADAGGRDDPARRRQPVLVGRGVDFAPGAAAADPHRAGLGIDLDVLQAREVEDDAVVAGAQPGAVVAAAAHRQQERRGRAAKETTLATSSASVAVGDQRRAPVDHRVVDLAGLVVAGVLGADQPSLEVRTSRCGRVCIRALGVFTRSS